MTAGLSTPSFWPAAVTHVVPPDVAPAAYAGCGGKPTLALGDPKPEVDPLSGTAGEVPKAEL